MMQQDMLQAQTPVHRGPRGVHVGGVVSRVEVEQGAASVDAFLLCGVQQGLLGARAEFAVIVMRIG